jgi:hypothetical protein
VLGDQPLEQGVAKEAHQGLASLGVAAFQTFPPGRVSTFGDILLVV